MHPRKKPTPSPLARPSGAPRGLSPARSRAVLPTVAALLAMAAVGCERHDDIARDAIALGEIVHPRAEQTETATPSLNVLEEPPPAPPPAPPTPVVKAKPVHPIPSPSTPPAPGGLKAVHPIDPLST